MEGTPKDIIAQYIEKQRSFFASNKTKDIGFRLNQLNKLKKAILKNQSKIEKALWDDLHKSPEEAFLTEISIVLGEINKHIKHLKEWARPKSVSTPLHLLPSSSKIIYEPLGVSLIVSPWNYPFQLLINPLVGSISAGGCCVLKPAPDAPATAKVIQEMILETFEPKYIAVVQGRRETNTI